MAGLSVNFWMLLIARMFTGVGEAALITLAPPFIIDYAPKSKKALYLAVVYGSMPVGQAIGYVYGNLVSTALGGWQWPFIIEVFLMAPLPIISLLIYKDPRLKVHHRQTVYDSIYEDTEEEFPFLTSMEHASMVPSFRPATLVCTTTIGTVLTDVGEPLPIWTQIGRVLVIKQYLLIAFGYAGYQFTVGGLSVWGPVFLQELYGQSAGTSTYIFGGITIVCGLGFTLVGSVIQDYRLRPFQAEVDAGTLTREGLQEKRAISALKQMAVTVTITICVILPFIIYINVILFAVGLGLGESFLFAGTSSVPMAIMASVPNNLR
jgi:MFS family permease